MKIYPVLEARWLNEQLENLGFRKLLTTEEMRQRALFSTNTLVPIFVIQFVIDVD